MEAPRHIIFGNTDRSDRKTILFDNRKVGEAEKLMGQWKVVSSQLKIDKGFTTLPQLKDYMKDNLFKKEGDNVKEALQPYEVKTLKEAEQMKREIEKKLANPKTPKEQIEGLEDSLASVEETIADLKANESLSSKAKRVCEQFLAGTEPLKEEGDLNANGELQNPLMPPAKRLKDKDFLKIFTGKDCECGEYGCECPKGSEVMEESAQGLIMYKNKISDNNKKIHALTIKRNKIYDQEQGLEQGDKKSKLKAERMKINNEIQALEDSNKDSRASIKKLKKDKRG